MLRRRFIQGLVAICRSPNSLIPPIPRSLHGSSFTTYSSHGPAEDAERLPKDVVLLTCPSSANGGVCCIYVVGFTHNTKLVQPAFRYILGHIQWGTLDKFKEAFDKALNGQEVFSVAAHDCTRSHMAQLDEGCADAIIEQAKWDTSREREKLQHNIHAHVASVHVSLQKHMRRN
ncbi:hypothetical protein NL676_006665 [Syzygium grande]|nr:hypothetical protein NL676_006665 [Syzygium grande]